MVRSSSEVLSREHEDHVMFRQEQDEQLLLWMQRFVVVYKLGIYEQYHSMSLWGYNTFCVNNLGTQKIGHCQLGVVSPSLVGVIIIVGS